MQGGLVKLAEAEATVDTLTQSAAKQRARLSAKQAEVDAAMMGIHAAMEAASSRKTEVEALSGRQAQEQAAVATRKVPCPDSTTL
jgi:predicted  nucleic acid-binding Zn-ribbon protein